MAAGMRFQVASVPICGSCGRRFSPGRRDGIRERVTGRLVAVPHG